MFTSFRRVLPLSKGNCACDPRIVEDFWALRRTITLACVVSKLTDKSPRRIDLNRSRIAYSPLATKTDDKKLYKKARTEYLKLKQKVDIKKEQLDKLMRRQRELEDELRKKLAERQPCVFAPSRRIFSNPRCAIWHLMQTDRKCSRPPLIHA